MEHFSEQVVTKHARTLDDILFYLAWALMIFFGILAFLQLQVIFYEFSWSMLILLVLCAGCAVFIWFFKDRLRTEYEYTFTNGDLDFAAVYNNTKRKPLGSLKVKNVEAFGPVNSQSFQRYLTMSDVKQFRWFLNRGAELYYFFFQKDGSKRLLIFEPNEEMREIIAQYLPYGASQKL